MNIAFAQEKIKFGYHSPSGKAKTLNNEEIKLEILRIVVEAGTLNQKDNPLPICENYYKWIKGKTIRKTLTGKKE